MNKALVWLLYQLYLWPTILAGHLVKWTGKSKFAIHPKHFLNVDWQRWYLPFLRPGARILDAGCGNASHTLAAAHLGATIAGFDRNRPQLKIGQGQAQAQGLNSLSLVQAQVDASWPFASGAFDVLLFLDVLEHLHRRPEALQEARRILCPGGLLLLSVPQRDTSWKKIRARAGLFAYSDPDHKFEYTQDEIVAELAQAGFQVEQVEPVVLDTPWAGLIDLLGGFSLGLYRRLAGWKRRAALDNPAESTGFRVAARKVESP